MSAWVLATDADHVGACIALARGAGGPVTCAVVGPRELADAAAGAGADDVRWLEPAVDVPAEAYAARIADAVLAAGPRLLVSTPVASARVLLGAAAVRLGAALVAGAVAVTTEDGTLLVEHRSLDGAVLETLATAGPLAVVADAGDDPEPTATRAAVDPLAATAPAALRVESRRAGAVASGVRDAARVVSVGRGVRAKADLDVVVAPLLAALGAELGCSMPVADDLGWVPKERYVGRSGQHIAPRLYLALGISGAPQHLEGVRDARVVAAVNSDPGAPIFRTADFGIVGDLYDVVPALVDALNR